MLLLCFLNSLFTGGVVKVNGLALSVKSYGFASSPKVGALGSPRKVHLFAKASPFGRGVTAGDGEGEDADHSAALSQKAALQLPLSVTTPPVKMRLERSAERDKREIKNNFSAEYAQSNAERIPNRLPQNRYKENPWNL